MWIYGFVTLLDCFFPQKLFKILLLWFWGKTWWWDDRRVKFRYLLSGRPSQYFLQCPNKRKHLNKLNNNKCWAVTWSVCIFGCVWWLSPESQTEMDDSTFKAFFRRPRWSFSLCVCHHCVLCILCFDGWIRSRTWFAINNNKFHSGLFIHIVPVYNNGHLSALYVVT